MGVHKNAITMKIFMSTITKVSITRRRKIPSVLFNYFVDVLHILFYISSVYSPFSDGVGLPLHNIPSSGGVMKGIGA